MDSSSTVRLHFGLVQASSGSQEEEASAAFARLAVWVLEHDGVALERRAWPTYRALAESVREGSSDVAWLPPVVHAWLAEGVTPLGCIARGGNTTYAAALVTLASSKLHGLADLAGARAGWVDPWSAAGYVVPRIELARAGIDPTTSFASETFYGAHRDALLALGRGACDVAGTYARIREGEAAPEGAWSSLEVDVRVVAMFGAIPSDVIAVRRNLAPAEHERALAAFRHACADDAARPLVHGVFGGDELREGIDPGHETLRNDFERATARGLFD